MTWFVLGTVSTFVTASSALAAVATAAFRIGPSRIRTLREEGFNGAESLVRLRSRRDDPRRGVYALIHALDLTATGVAVWGGASARGTVGAGVGLLATLALVAVGRLLARALAARRPVRLALVSAPFLLRLASAIGRAAGPLALVDGTPGRQGEGELTAEERELRELQSIGREEGVLGEEENRLVERAFRLDELTAWDVMTPRVDVFAWKDSRALEEIVDDLPSVPYSRVPVYGESVDDVTGIVYVREAYQAFTEEGGATPLSRIARDPFFVPGSLPLSRLLQSFQSRRIHMGIVADEFGGIDGLVTLEDVLEELVGDIVDETDRDEDPIVLLSPDELVADAGIDLRDINETFDVALPLTEHRSLNGFILEELGYVPPPGERMRRDGVEIEVLDATETQVLRARLTRLPRAAEQPSEVD